MKAIPFILFYIGMSLLSSAALNSNWRQTITCRYNSETARDGDMALRKSFFFGFIPVAGWVAAFAITGMYYDGFSLEGGPCKPWERK